MLNEQTYWNKHNIPLLGSIFILKLVTLLESPHRMFGMHSGIENDMQLVVMYEMYIKDWKTTSSDEAINGKYSRGLDELLGKYIRMESYGTR